MRDAHASAAFLFCFAIGFVFVSIDPATKSLPRYLPAERTWLWGTEDDARRVAGAEVTIDWYARSAVGLAAGLVGGLVAWLLAGALTRGRQAPAGSAVAWEVAALGLGMAVFLMALFAAKGVWRF